MDCRAFHPPQAGWKSYRTKKERGSLRLLLLVTTDSLLFRDILFGTVNHEGVPSIGGMPPFGRARRPRTPVYSGPSFRGKNLVLKRSPLSRKTSSVIVKKDWASWANHVNHMRLNNKICPTLQNSPFLKVGQVGQSRTRENPARGAILHAELFSLPGYGISTP